MDYVLTLIGELDRQLVARVQEALGGSAPDWLCHEHACDIPLLSPVSLPPVSRETVQELLPQAKIDFVVQPKEGRRKRLLVVDMDSTLVLQETIDLLGKEAGREQEITAITQQAMTGNMDFAQALTARVALLEKLDAQVFDRVLAQVQVRKGATLLTKTMRAHGAHCLLVSGGFVPIVNALAKQCGFEAAPANQIEVIDGVLSGRLIPPLYGAEDKKNALLDYSQRLGISTDQVIAIGDGANDVAMIKSAGLGICLGDKKVLSQHSDAIILYNDLTALLYMQGYRDFT